MVVAVPDEDATEGKNVEFMLFYEKEEHIGMQVYQSRRRKK